MIRDREEEFETQALLCTDLDAEPERIISWFARRWQMEATFQEVRQRLGFETQRHWSELAVRRTAPVLLGLFSMVTLFANGYMAKKKKKNANAVVRGAAWYKKQRPTFSEALALVRKELFVGAGSDFLRAARANRYAKSPGGIGATTNRCGLLRGVNGQSPALRLFENSRTLKPKTLRTADVGHRGPALLQCCAIKTTLQRPPNAFSYSFCTPVVTASSA